MNACLLFLPVAVSLDFFMLELRVPCFVFSFWFIRNRGRGAVVSSLSAPFYVRVFFLLLERLEGHGFVFSIYT
jgi:hypothetical protein